MYKQLQNLRQRTCSIDDYTAKFYRLVASIDLVESDDQLVSRHIRRMRQQFHDVLNFFDPINVSEAHQRALHLEKTMSRRPLGVVGESIRGSNCQIPHPMHTMLFPPTQNRGQANAQPNKQLRLVPHHIVLNVLNLDKGG